MVYSAIVQIGLGLPTVNAQTYTPFRDFSPYSTRSVRLNIPHMSHLDTPSLPFPDNAINVDIASWSRDVELSIRTVTSPATSEYDSNDPLEEERSSLMTDFDHSPVLSLSTSEYDVEVDSPRLMSPSNSANCLDVDSTPRVSRRANDLPRQTFKTRHIDIRSPSQYSDTTTVCCRTPHEDNENPSISNTECTIIPLSDATIHTAQLTDLGEKTDSGESTTGLDPNVKPFVPGQAGNTARRNLIDDPASREQTHVDQASVAPNRRLTQRALSGAARDGSTSHGHRQPVVAQEPSVVQANQLKGPSNSVPPGFQPQYPPGLPLNIHPGQHGPPPGLPGKLPAKSRPYPPPGLPSQPHVEPQHRSNRLVNTTVPIPEPVEPTPPGSPSKTIYMIRAGKGRSQFHEARARALHIPHCLDIPIEILGYNPSLSHQGMRQVENLCRQTESNIQARAQLLVTSPQRRALRTTAALFPLCRRLFKPNMVPVSRPVKALGLLNDTRAKPSVPLDLLAALAPDPRSQLYYKLKYDNTQINAYSSTSEDNTEDPLKEVRERAQAMRQWLWDRPETVIVVVSHNEFMHHMVDFGDRHTKRDHCQIREFTMFDGVEDYGPSLVEVPLDLSGPMREAPKSLPERIEERKMMCHVEE